MTQNKNKDTRHELQPTHIKPASLADVDFYASIINDPDVSHAQKRELIEVITAIVVSFVDIAFGVHPVQLAMAGADAPAMIAKASKESTLERSGA